jgi:fumarate reductase subunit D
MARRPVEPLLWLLFSGGGVLSALFLPVLAFLFAVAVPLGWLGAPGRGPLLQLVGHPLVALVLVGVCVLSLFHWAQRFRYTLFDGLKLKAHQRLINTSVYTVAVLGSVAAVVLLGQAVLAR